MIAFLPKKVNFFLEPFLLLINCASCEYIFYMNKIWFAMIVFSLCFLLVSSPESVLSQMLSASSQALALSAELCGVYVVWLGILELVEASGLSQKLAKLLHPVIKKIFNLKDQQTEELIAMNISANMLGLGNASTPLAIKAMKRMDSGSPIASPAMIMLIVINASSIQLLPTTVIGLRQAAGSTCAADIILPTLITTICTTLLAIVLGKLCQKIFKRRLK